VLGLHDALLMDRWAGDLYGDPCRGCGFRYAWDRNRILTASSCVTAFIAGCSQLVSERAQLNDGRTGKG
jgi:hypothetical protein